MNWLQKTSNDLFEDMFNTPSRQEVRRDPPQQEPITLTLYRGFDASLNELERSGDGFILSPHKSEQGVIWFSRNIEDANWRGQWLLTYPLQVIKHTERVYYDDGSHSDDIPDSVHAQCSPSENCRFYGGIELPEGWFFSYKVEKHIVCSIPIRVTEDMLQRVQ